MKWLIIDDVYHHIMTEDVMINYHHLKMDDDDLTLDLYDRHRHYIGDVNLDVFDEITYVDQTHRIVIDDLSELYNLLGD